MEQEKEYLGDGVYASFDDYQVWLETACGACGAQKIALEPNVYVALQRYVAKLKKSEAT